MKFSPVFTPVHQSHKQLISPAQLWRTAKISYFFLYFFQHDIENITLNANCSLEIRVAEDAYVFVSHSCFLSIIYDLCKRSTKSTPVQSTIALEKYPPLHSRAIHR